jgi:hypothetical protein
LIVGHAPVHVAIAWIAVEIAFFAWWSLFHAKRLAVQPTYHAPMPHDPERVGHWCWGRFREHCSIIKGVVGSRVKAWTSMMSPKSLSYPLLSPGVFNFILEVSYLYLVAPTFGIQLSSASF